MKKNLLLSLFAVCTLGSVIQPIKADRMDLAAAAIGTCAGAFGSALMHFADSHRADATKAGLAAAGFLALPFVTGYATYKLTEYTTGSKNAEKKTSTALLAHTVAQGLTSYSLTGTKDMLFTAYPAVITAIYSHPIIGYALGCLWLGA